MSYPKAIEDLIERLVKLPGVGRRSAERMVFWMLNQEKEDVAALVNSIRRVKEELQFCRVCHNLSDTEICLICSDSARDDKTICVVENPKDLLAIERTGAYHGQYHVLLGAISPAEGKGPDTLTIDHLMKRLGEQKVQEVVLATDADNDGEMTALYLTKHLKATGVRVSRIGMGLPMGSAIEYADISTLGMSLKARRDIS